MFAAPYENQIRLIFTRLNELIDNSPALLKELKSRTKNPFCIQFKNDSRIIGFTTGASSSSGGASIRGQRADYVYIDESDYMNDADFDSILMLAGERPDIGVWLSSTPTGARKKFWQCCTDPKMHFTPFHFPSMCNPDWGPKMEEEFRAQLSEAGYQHEVLAEFGEQETGVFDKEKLDAAMKVFSYAYAPLTYSQNIRVKESGETYESYIPPSGFEGVYRPNRYRTMGIDWDKYGASSSILILDYDVHKQKFIVIKRVEVPKAEYSFDAAVKMIINLNRIYQPSWIYADRGSGEYQIETLHMYGDAHKESGLKNKLKGFQFSQTIDVIDPVKKTIEKEPMKPFMVNQLAIAFERDRMILSPFDETLHKQLVDYEVVRIGANGRPVFTSVNEHFVDALGLAYLAMVQEFPELTNTVKKVTFEGAIESVAVSPLKAQAIAGIQKISQAFDRVNPWKGLKNGSFTPEKCQDPCEVDKPRWFKASAPTAPSFSRSSNWGSRLPSRNGKFGRRMW